MKHKPKPFVFARFPDVSRILSYDPGEKAGWALIVDGLVKEEGPINGTDVFAIWDLIKRTEPDVVVCEDQFVGQNSTAAKTIIIRRGHVETISKLRVIPFTVVPWNIWQTWAGVRRGDKPGYHRLAESILGRKLATEDVAAAVLIGMCYRASTV